MILFYVLLLTIALFGLRHKKDNQAYISVQQTNAIKGIFIWLVFLGHILPYMTKAQPFDMFIDKAASMFVAYFKQLVVVPFLFYSGYGVMNSIKNKGTGYVNSIPKKRVLNTMVNFSVAVSIFICMNLILGIPMELKQAMLSYLSWESVGNSNWYIFTICICYLTSYISHKLFGYTGRSLISNFCILSAFILIISRFKGSWWYDTCFAYAAGCAFCYYKDRIEAAISRKYYIYGAAVAAAFAISYILQAKIPSLAPLSMNICSMFFAMSIVILSMKFELKSRVLEWSGKNLFPLYIYQRLPMILFATISGGSLLGDLKYLYVIICAVVTIAIVHLYKYITIKL